MRRLAALVLLCVAGATACTSEPPPSATPLAPTATPTVSPTGQPPPSASPTQLPTPASSPVTTPPLEPAVLYYDEVGLGFDALDRWILDGAHVPERLVVRTTGDDDLDDAGWYHYSVSPDGKTAIWSSLHHDPNGWTVEGIDLSDGSTLWTHEAQTPAFPLAWSHDGTLAVGERDSESDPPAAVYIDAVAGTVTEIVPPAGAWIRGFAQSDDRLILSEGDGPQPDTFLAWDLSSSAQQTLGPTDAAVAESLDREDPFSAARGQVVEQIAPRPSPGAGLGVYDYATATVTNVAGLPDVGEHGAIAGARFDPQGEHLYALWSDRTEVGVPAESGLTLYAATPPAAAAPIWSGRGSGGDLIFSPNAGLVAFQPDWQAPSMVVVEPASGRSLELPIPLGALGVTIDRLADGPLPAAVPPVPVVTPPTDPATLVAGAPQSIVEYLSDSNGSLRVTFTLVAPAMRDGQPILTSVAETTLAAPGGTSERDVSMAAVPRPRSKDILLWIETPGAAQAWLWSPGSDPRPLVVPSVMINATAYALAWSLDGARLVGDSRGDAIVWFEPETGRAGRLELARPWHGSDVVGMTASGAVLTHAIRAGDVAPGCHGAVFQAVDLATGRLSQYEPDHDVAARVAGWDDHGSAASGYAAGTHGRTLSLDRDCSISGDDRTIQLPSGDRAGGIAIWSTDGESLFVPVRTASGGVMLRYRRPWALPGASPVVVGTIPDGAGQIESLSSSGRWAGLDDVWTISCVHSAVLDTKNGTIYRAGDVCGHATGWVSP